MTRLKKIERAENEAHGEECQADERKSAVMRDLRQRQEQRVAAWTPKDSSMSDRSAPAGLRNAYSSGVKVEKDNTAQFSR